MSSRQRSRLLKSIRSNTQSVENNISRCDEDEDGDDDTDDDNNKEVTLKSKSTFGVLDDDDSSDESEASEESIDLKKNDSKNTKEKASQPIDSAQFSKSNLKSNKKSALKSKTKQDSILDDELFNSLIIDKSQSSISLASSVIKSFIWDSLLSVDPKELDIDLVFRRRFGQSTSSKQLNKGKRFLLTRSVTDWPKPPSLIGGGIGMEKITSSSMSDTIEFKFTHSESFNKLYDVYFSVSDSGDPNQLVLFLNRYPYHSEGLLQLAMVFARTGRMDSAASFVKRALYCLEFSALESFQPNLGNCRLSFDISSNRVYYGAVFRHMQISNMLGCPSVSASLARLLLSLSPWKDPYLVLLLLDFYLLSCAQYDRLYSFMGIQKDFLMDPSFPLVDLAKSRFPSAFYLTSPSSLTSMEHPLTLGYLPNWIFSLALALFSDTSLPNHRLMWSQAILQAAIFQWPYYMEALLVHCKISLDSAPFNALPPLLVSSM